MGKSQALIIAGLLKIITIACGSSDEVQPTSTLIPTAVGPVEPTAAQVEPSEMESPLPAVTHVDHSARIQTVNADNKPDYYNIIKAFKDLTGYGIVVNTSFNVRGEPIVCSPQDAYTCFMRTEMDL